MKYIRPLLEKSYGMLSSRRHSILLMLHSVMNRMTFFCVLAICSIVSSSVYDASSGSSLRSGSSIAWS